MRDDRKFYGVLFVLAVLSLAMFNWGLAITDPVESNYALTAKEMLAAHNYFSPQIYGAYWYDKPIMVYWLLQISYAILGLTDFASRLPAVLCGSLTVVGVAHWARLSYGKEAGRWAGFFLLTALAFWVISRAIITDAPLLLWTLVTMYGAYRGLTEDRRSWMVVAYAGAGLACLTKGPVGLVLPGLILLVWLAVTPSVRRWRRLFDPVGILAFLAVGLPWYLWMYAEHGDAFIKGFLGLHNWTRATVSEHPRDNVWYYYLVAIPLYALPWTPLSLREIWRSRRSPDPSDRLALVWIGVTGLFYSVLATKYITYAYIAIIPLILLATKSWCQIMATEKRRAYWWLAAPAMLMILLWAGATLKWPQGDWFLFYMLCAVAIALIVRGVWSRSGAVLTAQTMLALVLVTLTIIGEGLAPFMLTRTSKQAVAVFSQLPDTQYSYHTYSASYVFYTGRIPLLLEETQSTKPSAWAGKYTMPQIQEPAFVKRIAAGESMSVWVPRTGRKSWEKESYRDKFVKIASFAGGDIYLPKTEVKK